MPLAVRVRSHQLLSFLASSPREDPCSAYSPNIAEQLEPAACSSMKAAQLRRFGATVGIQMLIFIRCLPHQWLNNPERCGRLERNDKSLPNCRSSAAHVCELLRKLQRRNKESEGLLNPKAGRSHHPRLAAHNQPCRATLVYGGRHGCGRIAISSFRKSQRQVGPSLHLSWYELKAAGLLYPAYNPCVASSPLSTSNPLSLPGAYRDWLAWLCCRAVLGHV